MGAEVEGGRRVMAVGSRERERVQAAAVGRRERERVRLLLDWKLAHRAVGFCHPSAAGVVPALVDGSRASGGALMAL